MGRSRAPLDTFDVPTLVADALAVLDAAGAARAVVVGQSLGGMIGLQLALRHPERVAGFVACDSSLALDHPVLLQTLATRALTHAAVSIEQRSLGRWFLEQQQALAALYAQINHFNPSAYEHAPEQWRVGALPAARRAVAGADERAAGDRLPDAARGGSEDPDRAGGHRAGGRGAGRRAAE